jgi:endoglucanase
MPLSTPPSRLRSVAAFVRCICFLPLLGQALASRAELAGAARPIVQELAPEPALKAQWPVELRTAGNKIVRPDGTEIWLQGVNVVSLEFRVRGEHVLRAAQVAIDEWKSNIVRLPVKDDYWFGRDREQQDGGAAYRALVDAAITVIANRGAYVLLDLHRFRAPTAANVEFWREVAMVYKDHPAVLFDVFNEPHGLSWKVWREGGFVPEKETPADEDSFLSEEDQKKNRAGFESPGMQRLVDAVRETGAKNIIVVGGLDWAYDLTGIMEGYAIDDRDGNGIVYATHIYPWKSDWVGKALVVAEKYPIIVGEVGCDIKKLPFVSLDRQEDPYTWAPDMIGFIQQHRLHWTAFSFHPWATPVLIKDWSFEPTPFWGEFVKAALAGRQFELKKTR